MCHICATLELPIYLVSNYLIINFGYYYGMLHLSLTQGFMCRIKVVHKGDLMPALLSRTAKKNKSLCDRI